jgi:quinol-cytochrome oxidoreductase complex cytochrome b subunit
VVPFTWTIHIKEKQYYFSIWKNVNPLTIYFQLITIFFVCLFHILTRFFFQFFWLHTKCREKSDIFEKQNCKRVCVKDEWKCLLLLYISISLFCLSYCKTNVVTKFIVLKTPVTLYVREFIKSWLWKKKKSWKGLPQGIH